MTGSMISYAANGRTNNGYLALPPSGTGPGLIVIQEWWGLVGHIKDLADRFAAAGFVTLAPDMYHGEATTNPDHAAKMLMALNIAEAAADLRGAAEYLHAHAAVAPKKVGSLGFCMGGQLALFAAQELPELLSACVDFYGIHPKVEIVPERVKVPVLGHFGRDDKSVPLDVVHALANAVNAAGGSFQAHEYDAGHAFFNDGNANAYNPPAAEIAWTRTLAFLNSALA
jgi:carboxymethylenebutenolidase